jgi:hypothetical protein
VWVLRLKCLMSGFRLGLMILVLRGKFVKYGWYAFINGFDWKNDFGRC